MQRYRVASSSITGYQTPPVAHTPCTKTIGGPSPVTSYMILRPSSSMYFSTVSIRYTPSVRQAKNLSILTVHEII